MTTILSIQNKKPSTIILFAFIVGALTILMACWMISDDLPLENKLLASLLGLVSLIPILLYLKGNSYTTVPLFAMNCLFYFIAFSVNGFFFFVADNVAISNFLPSNYFSGLMIGLVGLLSQMIGYYIYSVLKRDRRPFKIINVMKSDRVRALAWTFIVIRALAVSVPSINEIPTVRQFVNMVPFAGFGLLMMCDCERKAQSI
jgi:hypothetical protein